MSDNELGALLFTMIGIASSVWAVAWAAVKRGEQKADKRQPALSSAAVEERLTRIEHAVDAIAVEVERISEGQRFTTQLLAARAKDQAALPGGPAPRA